VPPRPRQTSRALSLIRTRLKNCQLVLTVSTINKVRYMEHIGGPFHEQTGLTWDLRTWIESGWTAGRVARIRCDFGGYSDALIIVLF